MTKFCCCDSMYRIRRCARERISRHQHRCTARSLTFDLKLETLYSLLFCSTALYLLLVVAVCYGFVDLATHHSFASLSFLLQSRCSIRRRCLIKFKWNGLMRSKPLSNISLLRIYLIQQLHSLLIHRKHNPSTENQPP